MHKHDVKRGGVVIVVFLILINCAYIVHAFGISSQYLENETLKVNSGKSYAYVLTIQNGNDRDYYVDITYSSTNNVAELGKTSYYIPSNSYNNTFYFDINIPKDAKPGEVYILNYGVKPRINGSHPTNLDIDIQREIKILVLSEKTSTLPEIYTPEEKAREIKDKAIQKIKTTALLVVIIILIIIIINRVWHISKGMSSKVSGGKITNYTISESINLSEVKKLLEKMNNEEFDLPEIKNILKEKIAELTSRNFTHESRNMSRRELIKAIDKIKK